MATFGAIYKNVTFLRRACFITFRQLLENMSYS